MRGPWTADRRKEPESAAWPVRYRGRIIHRFVKRSDARDYVRVANERTTPAVVDLDRGEAR